MKTVLVAIYLAHGSSVPAFDYQLKESQSVCAEAAKRYAQKPHHGANARAFCIPVKEAK